MAKLLAVLYITFFDRFREGDESMLGECFPSLTFESVSLLVRIPSWFLPIDLLIIRSRRVGLALAFYLFSQVGPK